MLAAARGGEPADWPPSAPPRRRSAAAPPGLVNATDPELVVLSGLAAEMLLAAPDRVQDAYRAGLMQTIAADPPPLVAGALGDRGPLVGAMEAAFAPVLAHPAV